MGMTLTETKWHCYGCKQTHIRKFAQQEIRDFMVAQCPRCRKRKDLVRLRPRPFSLEEPKT